MKQCLFALAIISLPALAGAQTPGDPGAALPGAALAGPGGDLATIQRIYDALPDGAVVYLPDGSRWNGTIPTPRPDKAVTWISLGSFPNHYTNLIGDGDLSVSYDNGAAQFEKQLINTKTFNFPANFFLWNQDRNYTGAYSGNYNQMAAMNAKTISGPTSSGNSSAANFDIDSRGMNPSSAYDVVVNINDNKYGQNSVWGIVDQIIDFSGRVPQAFASWNEYDIRANGDDAMPMSNDYASPAAHDRVGAYYSFQTLEQPAWAANHSYTAIGTAPGSQAGAATIQVRAGTYPYVWYCASSGISGAAAPAFPVPAIFAGHASAGVLTVTQWNAASSPLARNDIITGGGFFSLSDIIITGQLSGTAGGAGTYAINSLKRIPPGGMFAAPAMPDGAGGLVWHFGEAYGEDVSTGIWFTGSSTLGTAIAGDDYIRNAFLDTTLNRLAPAAAAIRIGPDQPVDFSGRATQASQNLRTLSYSTYQGADTLVYQVKAAASTAGSTINVFQAKDSGAFLTTRNMLDDGGGNQLIAGSTTMKAPLIDGDTQYINSAGASAIAARVSKIIVTASGVALTMPAAPGNAPGSGEMLDVIFTGAAPAVTWSLGSGTQAFGGAPLPARPRLGADVRFIWLQDQHIWEHIIPQ